MFRKRYRSKPIVNAMNEITIADNDDDVDGAVGGSHRVDELTEEGELEYKLFFRTCIVARDKDILKIRLKKSIKLRETMMKEKEEFFQIFPFYFIDSDLV